MKKRELLFLAPYPDKRYPPDGMINRIITIDSHFIHEKRTYLYVSLRKNIVKYHKVQENIEIFELNLFMHFFLIARLLFSAENIYSHSIHMIKHIAIIIIFLRQKIILDAHGVVPEEIEYYETKNILYYVLLLTEKIIFSKKNVLVVCVTNAMKKHFSNKYPQYKGKYFIYNIFPEQLYIESLESNKTLISNVVSNSKKIIVLYSGGTAGWQKIDLMLELMAKNQSDSKEYIILTGEPETFKQIVATYNISEKLIEIRMASPSELSEYYKRADYGFVLRDDNVVNNVASPTKLIEYLFYGIIPIVLTPNIGDYLDYGFEYVRCEEFINIVKPMEKSIKNMGIAKMLLNQNINIKYSSIILG